MSLMILDERVMDFHPEEYVSDWIEEFNRILITDFAASKNLYMTTRLLNVS